MEAAAKQAAEKVLQHDGDTWRVLGEGATRDSKTYAHLASTTRGRHQKNGFMPMQMCDWIDSASLAKATGAAA